jgi:hypothetical protein
VTRTISLPIHGALELLGGIALLVGPFLIGAGPAALVAGVALGVLLAGIGVSGTDSLPLGAHQAFDLGLVAALGAGGLGLAAAGDPAGGLLLAVVGALELTLVALTRWARA